MIEEKDKLFDLEIESKIYTFRLLSAQEYLDGLPAGLKETIEMSVRLMVKASKDNLSFKDFMDMDENQFKCLYAQYQKATTPKKISFLEKK